MNRLIVCALVLFIAEFASPATLSLLWKNTDAAAHRQWGDNNYPSWQGFGMGGKYFIQNVTSQVIEVWDNSGKLDEIPSGKGTNISHDDAGNIIVRYGSYLKPILLDNQLLVINKTTGQRKIISEAPLAGDKCYLFGKAIGNVFKDYGTIYIISQGSTQINKIALAYGNYLWDSSAVFDFSSAIHPDIDIYQKRGLKAINNNAIITPCSNNNPNELAISNPYYNLTGYRAGNANSIYKVEISENELTRVGFFRTPFHNGCAGFDILTYNDSVQYIVYPSGINNIDGFSVAKVEKFANNPKSDETDIQYLVATKEEDTENGKIKYLSLDNELKINNLNFEVIDGKIYIYQYIPGAYIAMYEFDPNENNSISNPQYDLNLRINNCIVYFPNEKFHAIYNLCGQCVASGNSQSEYLEKGIYIVRYSNQIQKIIIN